MPQVDACKALSDPEKIGRIYFILESLLKQPIHFKAKAKRCNKLLQEAVEWSKKPRVVGALKSYRYLNEAVFARLPTLRDYETIFTTSESKDPNMGYVCTAIFSEFFALGDKILQMENELYEEFGPSKKQIVYFPVAPILFPAVTAYENDKVILKFPFSGIFEEINSKLPGDQRVNVSEADLVRRLDQDSPGQKGIYQFKTLLFYPAAAKLVFVDPNKPESIESQERLLEDCTYEVSTLHGNAYKNVCDKLCLREPIPLFSEEGGYAAKVFDAGGIGKTTFGQVTRSPKAKRYGSSSDSAIKILKSAVCEVRYGGLSFHR